MKKFISSIRALPQGGKERLQNHHQLLAFLFPPTWDPCEPYLALAALAAYTRERGVPTLASDENHAFFRCMVSAEYLRGRAAQRLEQRASLGDAIAASHLEGLTETIRLAERRRWWAERKAVAEPGRAAAPSQRPIDPRNTLHADLLPDQR